MPAFSESPHLTFSHTSPRPLSSVVTPDNYCRFLQSFVVVDPWTSRSERKVVGGEGSREERETLTEKLDSLQLGKSVFKKIKFYIKKKIKICITVFITETTVIYNKITLFT